MEKYISLIDDRLKSYLDINYPKVLGESMNYSVFAGGKRVRGLLCVLSNKALGGNMEDILPFACAIEMIHTYSLIHDDLPAMDDDDFRRGKPSNHKVYGEGVAILAGDGLLNRAYEIMSEFVYEKLNKESARALNIISVYAGVTGMIGGQTLDVISEGKGIGNDELEYIQENKTAALFKASMGSGAVMAGVDDEIIRKFELSAYYLGIAFQIKDDILDVESTMEELGKPIGSDVEENKNTYVSYHGLKKSKEDFEEYSNRSIEILEEIELENRDIIKLMETLLERTY